MRRFKLPRLFEALNNPLPTPDENAFLINEELYPFALKPSPLRPDCPVGHRIRIWTPPTARHSLDSSGTPTNLNKRDLDKIREIINEAYAPTTRSSYGTGLYAFHFFCDHKDISEEHRSPVNPTVLASFISTMVGIYGGSTIRNYVYGIRAWHIIHGIPWNTNREEVDALLKAGRRLTPKEAKRAEKKPWTIEYLKTICGALNQEDPRDIAVLACITTAFWGTARLGEVTVPALNKFNPKTHVKVSDVEFGTCDPKGNEVTVIFIPWTKTAGEKGEKIYWAKRNGVVDPQAALEKHLALNKPGNNDHLFSYRDKQGLRPMSRGILLRRLNSITSELKLEKLPGHGIRVGSTLEYLLRGLTFEAVKVKGRWKSDAFKVYLRNHAQVMAELIQERPAIHEAFLRYTIPSIP